MKTRWIRETVTAALIAAMYTALTVAVAPLSYGLVQCRVSEALTVLAAFTPAAVPGLTVGCFLSNLIGLSTGANIAGALDLLLGPLATGLAALLSYRLRRYRGHRAGLHLAGVHLAGAADADRARRRGAAGRLPDRRCIAGQSDHRHGSGTSDIQRTIII